MGTEQFMRYRYDTAFDSTLTSMTMEANFLYVKLASNADMSSAGVAPLVPAQFLHLASNLTEDGFWVYLAELEAQRLVIVDRGTGEVMVRSYVRHSNLVRTPTRVKHLVRVAWSKLRSPHIRAVLIVELARLWREAPDLKAWTVMAQEGPDLWSAVEDAGMDVRLGRTPDVGRIVEGMEMQRQFDMPAPMQSVDKPVDSDDEPPY